MSNKAAVEVIGGEDQTEGVVEVEVVENDPVDLAIRNPRSTPRRARTHQDKAAALMSTVGLLEVERDRLEARLRELEKETARVERRLRNVNIGVHEARDAAQQEAAHAAGRPVTDD